MRARVLAAAAAASTLWADAVLVGAFAETRNVEFARTGAWEIVASYEAGDTLGWCGAKLSGSDGMLKLNRYSDGRYILTYPSHGLSADYEYQGVVAVDRVAADMPVNVSGRRAFSEIGEDMLEAFSNGENLIVKLEGRTMIWPLEGSDLAVASLRDCVEQSDATASISTADAAEPPAEAPSRQQTVKCPLRVATHSGEVDESDKVKGFEPVFNRDSSMAFLMAVGVIAGPENAPVEVTPLENGPELTFDIENGPAPASVYCHYEGGINLIRSAGNAITSCMATIKRSGAASSPGWGLDSAVVKCR